MRGRHLPMVVHNPRFLILPWMVGACRPDVMETEEESLSPLTEIEVTDPLGSSLEYLEELLR